MSQELARSNQSTLHQECLPCMNVIICFIMRKPELYHMGDQIVEESYNVFSSTPATTVHVLVEEVLQLFLGSPLAVARPVLSAIVHHSCIQLQRRHFCVRVCNFGTHFLASYCLREHNALQESTLTSICVTEHATFKLAHRGLVGWFCLS